MHLTCETSEMTFEEALADHLSSLPAAPFLFVGSGFSRRYADADDWAGLLRRFAAPTGRSYEQYASRANGNLPTVASLIAEDFHDVWWRDDAYKESRKAHPAPKSTSSPLKIEIANYLSRSVEKLPKEGSLAEELATLQRSTIEGVITTNYDSIIDSLFPEFSVFSGQDELLFHEPQGIGEIYKIHGSCADPESLVLDASDYERFKKRNVYLAAKLLTIFVEHPIIFLGYSLTDPDVQEILTSIAHVLTNENLSKLQDRLIFIQWDPEFSAEPGLAATPFAADGMAIPMQSATVSSYMGLFKTLSQLRRRFPTKFLRQLKEQVYELARTSEPRDKVYVMDIDADVDTSEVDVVVGVGIQHRLANQGITGIERKDLFDDVLEPALPDDPETMNRIVAEVLPRHLSGATNTPVYRYLNKAGLLKEDGMLKPDRDVPASVERRVSRGLDPLRAPSGYHREKAIKQVKEAESFASLVASFPRDEVLFAAPHMPVDKVDVEDLRNFLIESKDVAQGGKSPQPTQWSKCLCFYDYLVNCPGASSDR